jgi:hypothetical protein
MKTMPPRTPPMIAAALVLWWPLPLFMNCAWESDRPGTEVCVVVGVGIGESVPDWPAPTSGLSIVIFVRTDSAIPVTLTHLRLDTTRQDPRFLSPVRYPGHHVIIFGCFRCELTVTSIKAHAGTLVAFGIVFENLRRIIRASKKTQIRIGDER